jgi:hypothetical protein
MPEAHRRIVDQLPWAMAQETERYLAAVRANAREVFADAGVRCTQARLEQLLFFAAIQSVWASINAQFWILDQSLGAFEGGDQRRAPRGISAVKLGSSTYRRGAGHHRDLAYLRGDLDRLLRRLEYCATLSL